MTYLGVTILFSAIFLYPYVRESYTIRILLSGYFYISSIITKKKWYLKSSKEKQSKIILWSQSRCTLQTFPEIAFLRFKRSFLRSLFQIMKNTIS
jgi:cytochrome c oxidase assembly factor CtaG